MATDFVTDTHGLIWYLEDSPRLGSQALAAFDACDRGECIIYIPTICLVEIVYLQEKGRIGNRQAIAALANNRAGRFVCWAAYGSSVAK